MTRVLICRATPINPDPRVEKEALSLSRAGYDVIALGWDPGASLPLDEDRGTWRLLRLPVQAGHAMGLGNLPGMLRWQWGLWRWLVQHRSHYDLIHACDFDTVLPALAARRMWRKKVIYDIFDFYSDMLRLTPGVVVRLLRWLDLKAIGKADGVILADASRREQISGAHPRRLAVVYNCLSNLPEGEKVEPQGGGSLRISYVGNLQVQRGLLELMDVVRRHPDYSLDLAGFGPDEDRILQAAQGMKNLAWHGRLPYAAALRINQGADVMVATYDPSIPNHRYSSPNKVFEAMLLARPVVVARGTNMDALIEKEDCGLVVPYGDIPALEAALERLHQDPQMRARLGANARRAFEREYHWEKMEVRLLALYQEVLT